MKKSFLTSLLFLAFHFSTSANIAQPGMWQAGGMGNYALMFPEDSLGFQKIQMKKERVSILLHKGFAVVKGEYWMHNDTDQTVTIKTGYPINGFAEGENTKLVQAIFDELHGLKVLIDGKVTPLIKEQKMDDWYVWNNTFPKNSTTKIEVYFLMDTNQARVRKGYEIDYSNGFVYLLETGSVWKQPILEGEIRIQTSDDLKLENLKGVFPSDFFEGNGTQQILRGNFTNLSPTDENNIIIRYGQQIKNFDFEKIVNQRDKYFTEADELSQIDFQNKEFIKSIFPSPFNIPTFEKNKLGIPQPTGLVGWFQIAFWGIIALFVLTTTFIIYKLVRKRKN